MFFVKMECSGKAVRFVEVPDFRINTELVEQTRATRAEDDVLRDAAAVILIVKTMRDLARERIVFLNVGAQEEHRHGAENVARKVHRLDPHRMTVNQHSEANAGVLQEGVFFFAELNGELTILTAGLIIVTVGPKDADAAEVLFQVGRCAHVGSGQKAESTGVNFEALIDRKLAGKIHRALGVLRIDLVAVRKWFGEKG